MTGDAKPRTDATTSCRKNDFGLEHALAAHLTRFRLDKLSKEVGSAAARGRGLAEMRWSQRAVAARAGFSSANLCQYERRRVTPRSFEIWERWARALGLTFMTRIAAASLGAEAAALSPTASHETNGPTAPLDCRQDHAALRSAWGTRPETGSAER